MFTTVAFVVGQTYTTRSPGDHDCIISVTIASRTAKTVKTGEGKRYRVGVHDGVEFIRPWGRYSMAPVLTANAKAAVEVAALEEPTAQYTDEECRVIAEAERILYRACSRGPELTDPARAGLLFSARLANKEHEQFCVAFLDTRHRLLAFETLFYGTIDGATVHPRVVVKRALQHNAAAVLIGHQHPSGNPEPSRQDVALTRRLGQALALIDVRLLDHLVCAPGAEPKSLAEMGLYASPAVS